MKTLHLFIFGGMPEAEKERKTKKMFFAGVGVVLLVSGCSVNREVILSTEISKHGEINRLSEGKEVRFVLNSGEEKAADRINSNEDSTSFFDNESGITSFFDNESGIASPILSSSRISIPTADIKSMKTVDRNAGAVFALLGFFAGAGTGAAFGASGDNSSFVSKGDAALTGAIVLAPVGAIMGYILGNRIGTRVNFIFVERFD